MPPGKNKQASASKKRKVDDKVDDSVAAPAAQQAKGNRIKDIGLAAQVHRCATRFGVWGGEMMRAWSAIRPVYHGKCHCPVTGHPILFLSLCALCALCALQGNANIKLAERNMYALVKLRERYAADKPFDGLKISINLHVTKETAVLVKTLLVGGASVAITGCNSFSTQDEIAASLAEVGCTVHAIHGCSNDEYRSFLDAMVAFNPDLIIDDGGDLTVQAHKDATPEMLAKIIGACEQTTSGVLRMKNMTTAGSLKCTNGFFFFFFLSFFLNGFDFVGGVWASVARRFRKHHRSRDPACALHVPLDSSC